MNTHLIDLLIDQIRTENLARYAANAAEPYDPVAYDDHEQRIGRLVEALCDGDDELVRRFCESLFDITFDGLGWYLTVFAQQSQERAEERAEARELAS